MLFNFNTLTETVPSSFFVYVKSHVVFMGLNSSARLGEVIFFYIIFFTTCSAIFLLSLRYAFTYNYFRSGTLYEALFWLVVVLLFLNCVYSLTLALNVFSEFSGKSFVTKLFILRELL